MKPIKIFNDQKAFEIAADKTRRRITHLLRARALSVSQIADELDMTPQAIYHHIRKMLEVGLIEIAKEERIDHFIETYYQASAEVFQFNYSEESDKVYSEARTEEALKALKKIGVIQTLDDGMIAKFAALRGRLNTIHQRCSQEPAEKIAQLEEADSFTKQDAIEISCLVSLTDEQFEETQQLNTEMRRLLKSI